MVMLPPDVSLNWDEISSKNHLVSEMILLDRYEFEKQFWSTVNRKHGNGCPFCGVPNPQ